MAALTARELCPNHMVRMMQRLGIEPGGGVVPHLSLSYIAAFHRCETCPYKQACRDWLDSVPASVLLAPRFCQIADILLELRVDQPGAWIDKARTMAWAGHHVRETDDLAYCRYRLADTDESDHR